MFERTTVAETEAALFFKRLQYINGPLAASTLGLAAGALGTDASSGFAFLFAVLVLIWLDWHDRPYHRIFKLWREVQHPFTRAREVWRLYLPFSLAWVLLGLIAMGILTKSGLAWPFA